MTRSARSRDFTAVHYSEATFIRFDSKMPGMVVFGRRWGIASDDLVFPGAFELFIRVLWWIGTVLLYSYHKGQFDCNGKGVLHIYLIGLLVVLALVILSLCAIVYVSAQGTITNPGSRRCMPTLVYLRALLYLPELMWACLGAVWVSDDGKGCDPATVGVVVAAVVASWIILLFTALGVIFVFDPMGDSRPSAAPMEPLGVRHLESSGGTQFLSTARSLAVKVWESRLRLLCCCLPQDESNRAAFSSISQLVSGFFSDTDLVPSDIAAGLALIHQEQDKMERSRDPDVTIDHSPSSPIEEDLESELEKAVHFMHFAAAAYGWPLYVYSNLLTGPCKLSGDCCRSRADEFDIVGADHLGCNFSSILQITGLQDRDFIHVSFHNQIYEIPFFVVLDHKRESILVAVRGTLSLKDALTDLSAECENMPIDGVTGACYAHKGISQAASYIYRKLVNDGILNQAFSIVPYKLVITGHSLGAGAAAVLAILLRHSFPTLQCYAFSPPGGLLSKALADYSKDFVVSVVLGKDLVPRLSLPNMEDLKRKILKIVSNCNKPKYRILLQGCWYELFGGEPDDSPSEMVSRREEELNLPLLGEESLLIHQSSSYQSLASDDSPLHTVPHMPFFLPGRVLHILEDGPTRRSCFSQVRYRAEWSNEMAFRSILISPSMLVDHMPDAVLRALKSLTSDKPYSLCPSSSNHSQHNVV
ncbi:diacylglycerol lipase-beta-like isoform X1 [Hippocampus zosterae]|uniref:diacylglycerol lipase-beta-like isoform X3 n=1 Tax=Hippocampus zosterae TaxID=109293 RepID=UPI00223C9B72|nr:diacylglycerol lipase-beta-like isoform X3 [Hippocampus zosterae]XP_051927051.1 diacylglycerol lipase-beta-like isoform X1 [Hippocampus zosterae]XP_051927052.1 diacylglycerol lipase-beta-like isoform X1 [Hippocampus zosterae]